MPICVPVLCFGKTYTCDFILMIKYDFLEHKESALFKSRMGIEFCNLVSKFYLFVITSKGHIALLKGVIVNKVKIRLSKEECEILQGCPHPSRKETVHHINNVMGLIIVWSKKWQVIFTPEKTQVTLITRCQVFFANTLALVMDSKTLAYNSTISILWVQIDNHHTLTDHIRGMAKNAARKLACIHHITPLLDAKGCYTLYHTQVRPVMEYCPLVWSCCPSSHQQLLDRVQN
nr:uncharacterized protein LOC113827211 [Penaeus vannamei]